MPDRPRLVGVDLSLSDPNLQGSDLLLLTLISLTEIDGTLTDTVASKGTINLDIENLPGELFWKRVRITFRGSRSWNVGLVGSRTRRSIVPPVG